MDVKEQIKTYIASQPEAKASDMQALHQQILKLLPKCKLWFLDGKDEKGKVVSNPNIGYGLQTIKYADGKTREFYQIGLSANTTGISVYILGIKDKVYLANTYGKKIGKASVSGYCIKFKALKDIDVDVLKAAIFLIIISPEERYERIEMQPSLCVVDKTHFFHRGRITIPIIDHTENLIFNVWTSISEENFGTRVDLWEDPKRIEQEPYFGWLQTIVPTYGDTINIKTVAFEQAPGLIPEIKVFEEQHSLTIDPEKGISYKKALEIVDQIMSDQHKKK